MTKRRTASKMTMQIIPFFFAINHLELLFTHVERFLLSYVGKGLS
jgi:hypothetical protein